MAFRKTLTSSAFSLLSAALLALAFPKANFIWLAWIGLVPLLSVIDGSTRRASFGFSYLCGLVFFLVTLQWIHFVTTLGLVLLAAYLALYFGLFGLAVRYVSDRSFAVKLFVIPAVWCVLEFVRERFLTGFGWGALGHTQASNILLIQVADITGVAGVSFLVAAFNVAVWEIVRSLDVRRWTLDGAPASSVQRLASNNVRPALIYCLLLVAALAYGAFHLSTVNDGRPKLRVALIQGNVALGDYWDPQLKADTIERYLRLSHAALVAKPDLVIWPETSFPQFLWDHPELFNAVRLLSRQSVVPLIFGAVTRESGNYFNSALYVDRSGEVSAVYSKLHLVVFGEFIPFRRELPFLADIVPIDDFTPGTKPVLFPVKNGVQVGTLICFEDTLPWLARQLTEQGANVLVNITNDAWFRDSAEPEMHLNNALFRAVENRRPLVRATNTGVSCLIDSLGVIGPCVQDRARRQTFVQGWVVGEADPGVARTFYSKYGDIFTFLLFIAILGVFIKPYLGRKPAMEEQTKEKKILIIDDDRMLQGMLLPILKSYGFEVVSALNGEEGLKLATSERPDVIILDVIMPKMKGREVCKRLKESPDTKAIPVIFLTSKSSEDDIKAEFEVGAAGHITKPVQPAILVRRINEILK